MKRNYFSLSYTDEEIRIVKIANNKILSVSSCNIPAGIVNNGKILRPKIFADLIVELKQHAKPHKITSNEIVAAIPEEKVFLKIIEIPKMPVSKIDSTIAWQIESLIPFEQEQIYYNWKIVSSLDGKLKILLAVCEKVIVDALLEALRLAKIKPLLITFPSIGLANLFANQSKDSILIIDLSRVNNITIIIIQNRNVYFSTSRHISSTYHELETIIHDSIEYYQNKFKLIDLNKIIIIGPAEIKDIQQKLQHSLSNMKVETINDIQLVTGIKQDYLPYINNLGLDLTLGDLNLLPSDIRNNCENENINYRLANIANYFILLVIVIAIFYGLFWFKVYNDKTKVSNEYSGMLKDQTSTSQKQIENTITEFKNKLNLITSLNFGNSIKPQTIEKIVSSANENISLREISIKNNKEVNIKGMAKNRNDLIIFKDNLNQLGIFSEITLPLAAYEKKDDVDFTLTTQLIAKK